MVFKIRMGIPEMEAFWDDLSTLKQHEKLDKDEEKLFKNWVEALGCLRDVLLTRSVPLARPLSTRA